MIEHMITDKNGHTFCKDCGYLNNCRCSWCPRCGQLTGNNTQGHYWAHMEYKDGKYIKTAPHHFCCPDACEYEGIEPTKPFHPRYIEHLEQQKAEQDRVLEAMAEGQSRAGDFIEGIPVEYKEQFPDMIASLKRSYGLD